jgi:lysophospholipase L1-like esterase
MTDRPKLSWKARLFAFGVIAALCVVFTEGASRFLEGGAKGAKVIQLALAPYMMFTDHPGDNPVWHNPHTNADIPSHMKFNNLGFAVDDDFSLPLSDNFVRKYAATPQQRLVLVTGGSAVYGAGATANDKTIAGQLEAVLNARQSKYKYRAINLGMGGWTSYQQFVGLLLFGPQLKPDWIVVMDGHNDGLASCAHGNGVGDPYGWATLLHIVNGSESTVRRSPLMQWLIQHTAAARIITGAQPTQRKGQPDQVYASEEDGHTRYRIAGTKVGDLDKQLDFYLLAQRNIKDLFASTNVLYSTQPLLFDLSRWYRRAFALRGTRESTETAKRHLKADLDDYMAKMSETPCAASLAPQTLGYYMARSAMRLEEVVTKWSAEAKNRSILYANAEMIFSGGHGLRSPNFVDSVHLTDLGQRRIGEYFAGYILQSDLNIPFDAPKFAESVRAETMNPGKVAERYSPPPGPAAKPVEGRHILEGLAVKERSPGVLQFDEQDNNGIHRCIWVNVPATAKRNNTLTIDVWTDTVAGVRVEMIDKSESYGRAEFDLLAPQVVKATGKNVVANIKDLGAGWKRLTLTVPLVDNIVDFNIALLSDDDALEYPGGKGSLVLTQPVLGPS